jgi:hypothetical protein
MDAFHPIRVQRPSSVRNLTAAVEAVRLLGRHPGWGRDVPAFPPRLGGDGWRGRRREFPLPAAAVMWEERNPNCFFTGEETLFASRKTYLLKQARVDVNRVKMGGNII